MRHKKKNHMKHTKFHHKYNDILSPPPEIIKVKCSLSPALFSLVFNLGLVFFNHGKLWI